MATVQPISSTDQGHSDTAVAQEKTGTLEGRSVTNKKTSQSKLKNALLVLATLGCLIATGFATNAVGYATATAPITLAVIATIGTLMLGLMVTAAIGVAIDKAIKDEKVDK